MWDLVLESKIGTIVYTIIVMTMFIDRGVEVPLFIIDPVILLVKCVWRGTDNFVELTTFVPLGPR